MSESDLLTTLDLCALVKSYPQKLQYLAVRFPKDFPVPVRLGGRTFWRMSAAKKILELSARLRHKAVSRG
jgi:hypothetical protein